MVSFIALVRRVTQVGIMLSAGVQFQAIAWCDNFSFDLPSSIECREVTTPEFAAANPHLKLIEAKLHISARLSEFDPANMFDLEYVVRTSKEMRVRDYSPSTTLENAVAEDSIEITAATEDAKTSGLDARVVYKPLVIGGSHSHTAKKSESSRYKQVAAQDLVLASGTIEREHGVFFRIRPSRKVALEGGREFKFVAVVPKTWRGDACDIACEARATKRVLFSTSVVPVGACRSLVGMYLQGDQEAAAAAEELRVRQAAVAKLSANPAAKTDVLKTISTEAAGLFSAKKLTPEQKELQVAAESLEAARQRLEALAK